MDLFIIAGPNGAGKTTFAREFLPNYADCKNFVNADLIAQGMAPFSPETAAFRAGKMMLSEIQSFAKRRLSFAFETTLSGRSYMGMLRRLKAQGYEVHLFFLWVESVDLALSRVRERVVRDGHDVPEPVVRRRFDRSIRNFWFTIAGWRTSGHYLTTQAQPPGWLRLRRMKRFGSGLFFGLQGWVVVELGGTPFLSMKPPLH